MLCLLFDSLLFNPLYSISVYRCKRRQTFPTPTCVCSHEPVRGEGVWNTLLLVLVQNSEEKPDASVNNVMFCYIQNIMARGAGFKRSTPSILSFSYSSQTRFLMAAKYSVV